ncbi:MAG: exodeoxyribonuclease VII large subunit [Gammaproteobacteria bacterium]|nr:exodeoxyribonuclease VII large subunit [Gammaproteobacteria bacterium]MBU1654656.1 exodeoxyribonuclease VII large subunit [Gammaproteobacteria bacterium]MBU1962452.1 exodeoxyribonuclease VII large subunit [Gammaproteobacteria bacterium]
MTQQNLAFADSRDIYSVSRLTTEVRYALERGFPLLWVQGEIGNLSMPASGHIYFNLKDAVAQVRCALFRGVRARLRFRPAEGAQVLARVRISFYEPRGDFQLIVEQMEPAGEGALRQALEALKQKLAAEGLFDPARKKALPPYPAAIGVLSSPSGAAIHDVLTVLKRRFPAARVILYPIPVQGAEAAREIVAMLRLAERRRECGLFILTRGGGSLEDLMAFNDEGLARAIAALETPLVSAVGHEIDFTLADLVADRRAPTPSAAAELVTPDGEALQRQIDALRHRLHGRFSHLLRLLNHRLAGGLKRLELSHPRRRIQQQQQRLDELSLRIGRAIQSKIERQNVRLQGLSSRLTAHHPGLRLKTLDSQLTKLGPRLRRAMAKLLATKRQSLGAAARQLQAISPLATLDRGYAIAWKLPERELLRDAAQVNRDDQIEVRLGQGVVRAKVVEP